MSDPVTASVPDVAVVESVAVVEPVVESVPFDSSVVLNLVKEALLAKPANVEEALKLYKDLCVRLAQAVVNMLPADQQKDALMLLWVQNKVEDVVKAVNCKKCW